MTNVAALMVETLKQAGQLPEVRGELLELAERFKRMAAHIERRYPCRTD